MKHIIAVLLENEPGALSRVVALFSARSYNIESLTVAPTEDASLSRMTIQTHGSEEVIEQITKHLNRLIEVVKVVDLSEGAYAERELMMVKVRAVGKERGAQAHGRHLPWPHHRRDGKELHHRGHGRPAEDRGVFAGHRPLGDTRDRPHGSERHWPRRARAARLSDFFTPLFPEISTGAPMKVFYDKDCDLSLLKGKTVAIIGYGSQGHAHAQNLNDSGVKVVVGLRKGGASWSKVEKAGLKVAEVADAVKQADVVMILLPDENIAKVYRDEVEPHIKQGGSLVFAHGFNVH